MTDFDYDVMLRKRLASQAKYRKRGSKSKKCPLQSDGMTRRQWERRNGEVVSMDLNRPMDWKTFKGFPVTMQETYLKQLQDPRLSYRQFHRNGGMKLRYNLRCVPF